MSAKISDLRQALITVAGYVDDVRRLEGALRVLTGGGEASRPAAPARAEVSVAGAKSDRRKPVTIELDLRDQIIAAIEASGVTDVARKMGISQPTLRRLRVSGNCHPDTLKAIVKWAKGRSSDSISGTSYEALVEDVSADRVKLR